MSAVELPPGWDTDVEMALGGIRVADFGQGVAGPYCAMLVADHGATVVKIEPPRGDWGRQMGTGFGDHSSTSIAINRNKQGVVIDLGDPRGVEVARDIIAWSNVVVENFRPGVMDRLGLGFEKVAAQRDDLVYCSVNGFGTDGPYVTHPAGDSVIQPMGGLMSIIGREQDPPLRVGNVVSDMLSGMNAFQGILLGILKMRATRSCQRVNVSLLDSILAFQAPTFTEYLMTGVLPKRVGNDHPLISPAGAFETGDGIVYFTVINHKWELFCESMGLLHLLTDSRFSSHAGRIEHREALGLLITEATRRHSTAQCLTKLQGLGIPSSRINDYADVMADAQVIHSKVFSHAPHDTLQRLPVVKSPVVLDGETIPYSHPPGLGQHTQAVLGKLLGYPDSRVKSLLASGVVQGGVGC